MGAVAPNDFYLSRDALDDEKVLYFLPFYPNAIGMQIGATLTLGAWVAKVVSIVFTGVGIPYPSATTTLYGEIMIVVDTATLVAIAKGTKIALS